MATTAKTQSNNVGLAAVGAVGNAYNARQSTRDAQKMNQIRLDQVRQNIAFNEAERARQAEIRAVERSRQQDEIRRQQEELDRQYESRLQQSALAAQEVERQQIMARASGGAFADSMGRFQAPAEAAVGDASSQIAQLYESYLSRPTATQAVAPAATGPAAEREASMREQATADVRGEGNRLAAVQGFGQYMSDNSRAMTANEQLAALINSFSRGSAAASGVEIGAEQNAERTSRSIAQSIAQRAPDTFVPGNFIRQRLVEPTPSPLADMFVGLSSLYANRAQQPQVPETDYGLLPPGYQAPGGYGVRMPRAGGDYGVQLPTDLGIGRTR